MNTILSTPLLRHIYPRELKRGSNGRWWGGDRGRRQEEVVVGLRWVDPSWGHTLA